MRKEGIVPDVGHLLNIGFEKVRNFQMRAFCKLLHSI
nr:MAG TPA: hypothetical protein [Caudoviricetes sp.]